MVTPFTGGCVCGGIRYECSARPDQIQMFRCHCRDCQQVSGGPYAPVVFVPAETFRITRGALQHHSTPSEMGGRHRRGFCPACGSRLTGGQSEDAPSTHIGVTASSLDDPTWFNAELDMWTADAQPWDKIDPTVPQHRKYPSG